MQCANPIIIQKNLPRDKYPYGLEVPCGKCVLCRIAKRREWSLRLLHENDFWEKSVFITLTYDDDHRPKNNSLVKRDLQLYFKRLRKNIFPANIKYYACGEYGEITHRPHYHAILFGLNFKDKNLLNDAWGKGFIKLGLVEPESIGYVCQYIDKKLSGPLAEQEYTQKNRAPVFKLSSQGLGKRFALLNKKQIEDNLVISQFGVKHGIPRYYLKFLDIDPSVLNSIGIQSSIDLVNDYLPNEHYTFLQYCYNNTTENVRQLIERRKNSNKQKSQNATAKISLKKSKL